MTPFWGSYITFSWNLTPPSNSPPKITLREKFSSKCNRSYSRKRHFCILTGFYRYFSVPVGKMSKSQISSNRSPVWCKKPFVHISHPARMRLFSILWLVKKKVTNPIFRRALARKCFRKKLYVACNICANEFCYWSFLYKIMTPQVRAV